MEREQEQGCVLLRDRAREMRREMTPAECRLWQGLCQRRCYGMRFLRQRTVGHFILDFYCPEYRLGIEVDGSIHDLPEVQEHDKNRTEVLLECAGIILVRFTNEEILGTNPKEWYAKIQEALTES
jgi:very-short-patch-repair endonuclease